MLKTTSKDFALYRKWFDIYMNELGLKCWDVDYLHEKIEEPGAGACVYFDVQARAVTTVFNKELEWERLRLAPEDIKRLAYHEALEVFLAKLRHLAMSKCTEQELDEAIHIVIQTLINVKFKT